MLVRRIPISENSLSAASRMSSITVIGRGRGAWRTYRQRTRVAGGSGRASAQREPECLVPARPLGDHPAVLHDLAGPVDVEAAGQAIPTAVQGEQPFAAGLAEHPDLVGLRD